MQAKFVGVALLDWSKFHAENTYSIKAFEPYRVYAVGAWLEISKLFSENLGSQSIKFFCSPLILATNIP
jgi:hypothetical protein